MVALGYILPIFISLFSQLTLSAQSKNFTLNIKIEGCKQGHIQLNYLHKNQKSFTKFRVTSSGDVFIAGTLSYPEKVFLLLNDSLYTEDFFISPGKQNLILDATSRTSFGNSVKKGGSEINDEYRDNYIARIQPYRDRLDSWYSTNDSLRAIFQHNLPDSLLLELNSRFVIIAKNIDSVKRQYVSDNPSSFVSLWIIYEMGWFIYNLDLSLECFQLLDPKLTGTALWQELNARLTTQQALLTGKTFLDLSLEDTSAKSIPFRKTINSKFTFVDFWFTNCGPCIQQFPEIKRIASKYENAGFKVISVSIDESKDRKKWKAMIVSKGLSWRHYLDKDGMQAHKLHLESFPTNFLLDSRGRILDKDITLDALEGFLVAQKASVAN